MKLIVRLIAILFLTICNLLGHIMAVVFQLLLLPLFIAVMGLLSRLIFFSFTAIVSGPRQYINRLAGEWTVRIHEGSSDRTHINQMFQLCRILVGGIIVLGLLVSGFFTYLVLRVVYGLFI